MENKARLEQARRTSLQHSDKPFILVFSPVTGG